MKKGEKADGIYGTQQKKIIYIMRMPEEKETRTESISEGIMAENFANMGRKINILIHKSQRTLIVNRAVLSLNSEQ